MKTTYNIIGTSCFLTAILIVFLVSCSKEEEKPLKVITTSVKDVSLTSVSCEGKVTSDGGSEIISRGICWNTYYSLTELGMNDAPTIVDNHTTEGTGLGSFTSEISGLTPNTAYNYRAYVTNKLETVYGDLIVHSTGSLADADGNVYHTVTIGLQEWMLENLKTTKYNDGTAIPFVTDDAAWKTLTGPAYCYSDNNESYKTPYGALYNWHAVNTAKLCPPGWHVPTDADWNELISGYGQPAVAGEMLKEAGTAHWIEPNSFANNVSGFTALPGSFRSYMDGKFNNFGYFGYYWSSDEFDADNAMSVVMVFNNASIVLEDNHKGSGLFVRCVKDSAK